ncbi:murein transglycosylase domain-containing protein [Thiomicrorhabdus aquaedulcis]|uniref:murein transglycosylase domain-containing protein n=1 Tax=Thiomicrorhabdus aquaedulcis TaxID=2211106 RepID=UPI001E5D7921|nr:murein transglycosylase domain-containing protein [Thiomicrorhabdus aquaedulcis]
MKRRLFIKQLLLGATYPLATVAVVSSVGLSGCTATQIRRGVSTGHQLYKGDVTHAVTAQIPGVGVPEIDGLIRQQLARFLNQITKNWGDKRMASPKEYVKYTDTYQSRALIDFNNGHIQVETLVANAPKTALKKAIISTLLTPDDPSQVDLFSDQDIITGKTPFLYGLVKDHTRTTIRTVWRANQYADWLIKNRLQTRRVQGKTTHFVQFDMVNDFQGQQQHRYQAIVLRQAKRFHVEPALISGIIETESAFNPYAVSHAPAYGLMQIVPTTAGRDVYRLLNQRDGTPSRNLLFQPAQNIEYGAAYLSILFTRYLVGVTNAKSREYCVIAAYNTGSGNVFNAFDSDRARALQKLIASPVNKFTNILKAV